MPQLSLTDLVDIVSRTGTSKARKVAEVKARPDYEPAFDFYRPLRERIVEIHRTGQPRSALNNFMATVTDSKKQDNYPTAVNGYKKWWGKKALTWSIPPRTNYVKNNFTVVINPELGLTINGNARCLVKLYFKTEPLSKLRVDVITRLMENSLRALCQNNEVMCVLDVRRAKVFRFQPAAPATIAMIDAELAYIESLWPNVP